MDEVTKQHIADGFASLRKKLHHCHVEQTKWMQKAKFLESELAKSESRVRELEKVHG